MDAEPFGFDIGAPIVAVLSNVEERMKEKIKMVVYQAVNKKYPDGNVVTDSGERGIYG